jgi:mRNA interferase HigB
VRIISQAKLRNFWQANRRAETPLKEWFNRVKVAQWKTTTDVKAMFASASFVGDRIVFNIGGNNYRLVVAVAYVPEIVFIKFVGTHAEYDKINVEEV